MQNDQAKPNSTLDDMRTATNWIVLILRSIAITAELYLRRGFGRRYLGLQVALAIPVIMVYCLLWPGHDLGWMLAFLAGFMAMCLHARVDGILGRWKGVTVHSRYNGRPRLLRLLPWMDEVKVKRTVEPAVVTVLGCLLMPVNQPLGAYLLLAAFALAAGGGIDDAVDRVREMDIRDALIEQVHLANGLRGMNGVLR